MAFTEARTAAEARHVDGEGGKAELGEDGAERTLQRGAAVEQFGRADVVAVAVGVDV